MALKSMLYVMLGSALGGLLRYVMSNAIYHYAGRGFPWGTLIINLLGCFFIGLLFTLIISKYHESLIPLHSLWITGFLGGFTTFSAFSFETVTLVENLFYVRALLYILTSVIGGMLLTALGVGLGKMLS